jgi:hypothetical protein
MTKLALYGAAWLFLQTLIACKSTGSKDLQPEDVVLQWQHHIDHNRFEEARRLSIDQARNYVDYLDELTGDDTLGMQDTEMFDLACTVAGDSALCRYFTEDEIGEKVPGQLVLRRVKGQWLVRVVEGFEPAPLDTLQPGEENLVFPEDTVPTIYLTPEEGEEL